MPLAEKGSKLFFVISDLCKINNMYRFSLASFLSLFQRALQNKQVCLEFVLVLYISVLHFTIPVSAFRKSTYFLHNHATGSAHSADELLLWLVQQSVQTISKRLIPVLTVSSV